MRSAEGKSGTGRTITALRRTLIVLFAVLLLPHVSGYVTNHSWAVRDPSIPEEAARLVREENATAIAPADAALFVDGDAFRITRVVVSDQDFYVMYRHDPAFAGNWISDSAIRATDDRGAEYVREGSGSSGHGSFTTGYIRYSKPEGMPRDVTLTYEWYDRYASVTIPLKEGGDADE
jgi:hypothetical protein